MTDITGIIIGVMAVCGAAWLLFCEIFGDYYGQDDDSESEQ